MKTSIRSTTLASTAILLLLSGTTAAFASTSQSLNLTVPIGLVTNLGTQTYTVAGGQVAFAMVEGQPVNPGATIQYGYYATVSGQSAQGWGYVKMTGTIPDGSTVKVAGAFKIDSEQAIATIGSDLPGFFVSSAPTITVTYEGSTQALAVPFAVESPYLNPFGMPIVLGAADNSVVIAATYSTGTIFWQNTQLQGGVAGSVGTQPASGTFTLTGDEFEDLVAGTASDMGTIAFSNMTPSSLNVVGTYRGSSSIPTTGTMDCSAQLTGIPGTCTETGFMSSGKFAANGVKGTYSSEWSTPALSFTTTIQGTVGQNSYTNNWTSLFSKTFGFLGF